MEPQGGGGIEDGDGGHGGCGSVWVALIRIERGRRTWDSIVSRVIYLV